MRMLLLLLLAMLVGQGAVGQEEGSGMGPEPAAAGVSSTQDPRDLFLQSINENIDGFQDTLNESPIFDFIPASPAPLPSTSRPTVQSTTPRQVFRDQNPQFDPTFRLEAVDQRGNRLEDATPDSGRVELGTGGDPLKLRCPRNWERFRDSCYKFTRSPLRKWDEARDICKTFRHNDQDKADLASVDTFEEHRFITEYLNKNDPQHRRWYISTRQETANQWVNQGDGTQMLNLERFFLKSNEWGELEQADYKKDYLAYAFSLKTRQWGFQPVFGVEEYLYICEVPIQEVRYLINDDRTAAYGQPIGDPRYTPMGPRFVRQPNTTVFDTSRREVLNDVSLLCIAQAWPSPTYQWFKEVYENDTLAEHRIQPLEDSRITISGGQLIIHAPDQTRDKGTYYCTASNKFGTIRSKSVSLTFGFIGEFILRRSNEVGRENWGKAISCDPPQHFPDIKYYWAREYFPNFVEEDRRVMVSYDGYIYFSALENIDRGNYSCNVQSSVSTIGRNGPFFTVDVLPHPNYQQLRFPQSFPKAFPEAPIAGENVRLECIAFGYPVPHYNWTRVNSVLPRGSYMTNYNRVLIIPRVRVEDQGDYRCTAKNDKVTIKETLTLSIQSRPVFTINIGDQFVDENDEVIWTCEAFGIPDVTYSWLRDGKPLTSDPDKLAPEDRNRYEIVDNVLKIRQARKDRDEGMYQCMASNDLESKYSSGQLKVLTLAPSFKKKPLDPKAFAAFSGNVTIACEPEAAPRPNITWYHNGNRIASGGKRRVFRNGNLFIEGLNSEDKGQYDCRASNKFGTAQSTTTLYLKDGPTFSNSDNKPISRLTPTVGNTVKLNCLASEKDHLDMAYYWRLNGVLLEFVEDYEHERILELKNAGGNRININEGANHQLAFKALGSRTELLSNSWMHVMEPERNKGTGDFQKFNRGSEEGSMSIRDISIAESGIYECAVETVVGTLYGSTNVIVYSAPGPPGGVTAVELTSDSGKVIWTDGAFYGKKIERYNIEGRTDHNQTWTLLAQEVNGREPENLGKKINDRKEFYLDKSLSPWSSYSFRVAGFNQYGMGEWSEPSPQYNTKPDKPYRSVSNIRSDGGRKGDLSIRWDPLPKEHQNAPGIYYKIYYREKGELQFKTRLLKDLGNIDQYVIRIEEELFYTLYQVKIQVFNDLCIHTKCDGPTSELAEIRSAEALPSVAPSKVGVRPFNSTAMKITWNPIPRDRKSVGGKLIGHRIRYWKKGLNEVIDSQYVLSRSTEPTATIIGLLPNSYYWVRVMAYNSAGPGPESERFLERTLKLRPQKPPSAVQVAGINPSTITVTWRIVNPSVEEEPLSGFKVRVWESDKDISDANDTLVYIGNPLKATISNLTPGKTYMLRVLAFSQGGEGKMSSPAWEFQMGDVRTLNAAANTMTVLSVLLFPLVLLHIVR